MCYLRSGLLVVCDFEAWFFGVVVWYGMFFGVTFDDVLKMVFRVVV